MTRATIGTVLSAFVFAAAFAPPAEAASASRRKPRIKILKATASTHAFPVLKAKPPAKAAVRAPAAKAAVSSKASFRLKVPEVPRGKEVVRHGPEGQEEDLPKPADDLDVPPVLLPPGEEAPGDGDGVPEGPAASGPTRTRNGVQPLQYQASKADPAPRGTQGAPSSTIGFTGQVDDMDKAPGVHRNSAYEGDGTTDAKGTNFFGSSN